MSNYAKELQLQRKEYNILSNYASDLKVECEDKIWKIQSDTRIKCEIIQRDCNKSILKYFTILLFSSLILLLLFANTLFSHVGDYTYSVLVNGKDVICYTTETGHKYHKESCGSLWNSKYQTTMYDAIKNGYIACDRCWTFPEPIYETHIANNSFIRYTVSFAVSFFVLLIPFAVITIKRRKKMHSDMRIINDLMNQKTKKVYYDYYIKLIKDKDYPDYKNGFIKKVSIISKAPKEMIDDCGFLIDGDYSNHEHIPIWRLYYLMLYRYYEYFKSKAEAE